MLGEILLFFKQEMNSTTTLKRYIFPHKNKNTYNEPVVVRSWCSWQLFGYASYNLIPKTMCTTHVNSPGTGMIINCPIWRSWVATMSGTIGGGAYVLTRSSRAGAISFYRKKGGNTVENITLKPGSYFMRLRSESWQHKFATNNSQQLNSALLPCE